MPDIADTRLQRLHEYWSARRGERKMPARADLDPVDMAFAMGNIILAEIVPGTPLRFRIRLHGSNLSERVGYELTGKMLDDMPAIEFRDRARRSFTKVATSGEPLHILADRLLADRMHRYETLILPLSADGERVDMLLIGLIYDDQR